MQPDGPYRFTEMSGACQVGASWWALDGQGRLVTVAVLDGPAAQDHGWREAFANAAGNLAQLSDGQPYLDADFVAPRPWVAYPSEQVGAAQRLFQTLGMELGAPAAVDAAPTEAMPAVGIPVSAQPVSAQPVSAQPVSAQPVSAQPVSAHPVSGQPISGVPGPLLAGTDLALAPADPFAGNQRRIRSTAPARRPVTPLGIAALVLLLVAVSGGLVFWTTTGGGAAADGRLADAPSSFPAAGAEVAAPLKPWSQFGPFSAEERALATALPSLVFIETVVTGQLRDASNAPLSTTPITWSRRCSGFVVSTAGHVLTSGSCVRPPEEAARESALNTLARSLVRSKKLSPKQVDDYVKTNLPKTKFTGVDPTAEPQTQVYGQLNAARSNLTEQPAIPGQVVQVLPVEEGDLGLVKLLRGDLPAVELNAGASLSAGASALVVGFRSSDTGSDSTAYTPRARLVTVTDVTRRGAVPVYRVSGDASRISHGGLALDPAGRVVGMLNQDQDQARPDSANDVVVAATGLTTLLDRAKVDHSLGESDRRYRDGLAAYFTGDPATAVSRLGAVAEERPTNLMAQAYRDNAAARRAVERRPGERPVWLDNLVVGAGGAVLALVVVALVVALRRRRA